MELVADGSAAVRLVVRSPTALRTPSHSASILAEAFSASSLAWLLPLAWSWPAAVRQNMARWSSLVDMPAKTVARAVRPIGRAVLNFSNSVFGLSSGGALALGVVDMAGPPRRMGSWNE